MIPAFNEEKVIAACVASVLRSDYPDFHVYIVDDGSTDRTAEVIRELIATTPRLHLLHEENAGKWHAANLALSEIDTPEVQLELNGDLDPGVLRPLDEKQGVGNQYLGVIMPMRL